LRESNDLELVNCLVGAIAVTRNGADELSSGTLGWPSFTTTSDEGGIGVGGSRSAPPGSSPIDHKPAHQGNDEAFMMGLGVRQKHLATATLRFPKDVENGVMDGV
jgi:hypothetical protein